MKWFLHLIEYVIIIIIIIIIVIIIIIIIIMVNWVRVDFKRNLE